MKKRLAMTAAAWLALGASGAQAAAVAAQDKPCITPAEADAMFTALAPEVFHAVRDTCVKTLPAGSFLTVHGEQFIARYAERAPAAKPTALAAFGKIAGDKAKGMLTPEMFDAMAGPMIGSLVGAQIKPGDCAIIDRVAELLDPLPPSNMSALVVLVLEAVSKNDKTGDLPICKGPISATVTVSGG